mmetsp:Transcript_34576/g.72758  ORF Transcript_34576/g.72758 Transcript_34576/m.72758 type:complete len:215 (-) Transcript_34576:745-1389(-)
MNYPAPHLPRRSKHVSDYMPNLWGVPFDTLYVGDCEVEAPPSLGRQPCESGLQARRPRGLERWVARHVCMHVEPAALWPESGDGHGPASLRAGDQAEVHAVRAHRKGGEALLVVARVDDAARGDTVLQQVVPQRHESVGIPLARVHHRRPGMHQVGQREVADTRVEVDDDLPVALELGDTRLLCAVSRGVHVLGHVERVRDAVVADGRPARGAL